MGSKCIKCGDCCEFIGLGVTLDEIKANIHFPDREFILRHWVVTSKPREKSNFLMSDKCFNGYHWYRCDLFDSQTRLCKDYENRPQICKDYPGKNRQSSRFISARCGFRHKEN